MTFLDPANLLLLGLLALVVAAYILRMPRRRLRVPDAMIARAALAEKSRISREKRTLISFVLQVVILVLLSLAAAMPFLDPGFSRDEGNRSLVVLLDVSASMQADDAVKFRVLSGDDAQAAAPSVTRFRKALSAVRGLARDMRGGDRMMLMAVSRTVDVVLNFQSDPDLIARALEPLAPTAEEANFADACRLAAQIARSQDSVEVVLVTDAALRPADLSPLAELKSPVRLVRVGERSGNVGITSFRVRRNLDSPTDYEALVSLVNTFDEPREVEVELMLNGTPFDIATVKVPAAGEAVHVFPEKLRVGGVLEARLRIADALAEDNVAWEILRPPTRLRVLLVSDDTSASSFLVRAVGSNASAVEGMVLTPEQYRKTIAPNAGVLRDQRDAVIFDRWAPGKPEELPPTHLLTIDCVPPGMPVVAGEPFDKPLIRKWEQGHPLMSYLNLRNVFISSARRVTVAEPKKGEPPVERVAEMVTSPLVLAWEREMPDGAGAPVPKVRRGRSGPQRFVVIAFDPRESDIILRKELPLLLWNSLLWFQNAAEPATQVAPGATITLESSPDSSGQDSGEVTVTTPGGRVETVPVDPDSGVAFFGDTAAAGVYRYRIGKKEDAFAVNSGGRLESNVHPAEDLGFKPEALEASELASSRVRRRALWPYLLFAAALLLAVEAIVFHRRIYF